MRGDRPVCRARERADAALRVPGARGRSGPLAASVLASVLVLVWAGGAGCGPPEAPTPRVHRSVVLITMDTTRADRLGVYGYAGATSPWLDALAGESSVFTRAISQAAVTPVSHASIFTGLEPYRHGLRVMHGLSENTLAPEQRTLAEALQEAGYETAAFVSAFPVTDHFGLAQGFAHFDDDFGAASERATTVRAGGAIETGKVQRHAGETTDRAIAWLDARRQQGGAAPFFLWLHYFDPHDGELVPPEDALQGPLPSGDDEREVWDALYDIEVRYMDAQIGRVLEWLRAAGDLEEAVVVVTADHGEGLGDHDWWSHGILYQEQIRVPLLIRAAKLGAGRRIPALVRSIDIAPTVLELSGVAPDALPDVDGRSLVALMSGESSDLGLSAYSDSVNLMSYVLSPGIRDLKQDMLFALVLDGRWKYIHNLGLPASSELYDLDDDPGEQRNLFATEPEMVRRAREALHARDFVPHRQLETLNVPKQVVEELEALGYAPGD
jgi:arylsulfatase A-like enzyme